MTGRTEDAGTGRTGGATTMNAGGATAGHNAAHTRARPVSPGGVA
ncbi:hypothetical protein [Nonomuraea sp. B1E8]